MKGELRQIPGTCSVKVLFGGKTAGPIENPSTHACKKFKSCSLKFGGNYRLLPPAGSGDSRSLLAAAAAAWCWNNKCCSSGGGTGESGEVCGIGIGAPSAFDFIGGNIFWKLPFALLFALKMLRALVMMSRSMGDRPGVVRRCHKLYCDISPEFNSEIIQNIRDFDKKN